MEDSRVKTKGGNLTFWMVALGPLAIWAGASDIAARWPALVLGARVCDVLILASGILLLVAGVWRLITRRFIRLAAGLACTGACLFAATLLIGVWTGAIPCSGSS